jgi:GNAT superfamily N-acetyltransferase
MPTPSTSPLTSIREARREDFPAVLALIDALADYEQLDRPDEGAKARLLADAFDRNPPRFQVYLVWAVGPDGSETAEGYAIVLETYSSFLARPTLYIEDLFVRPEARGKGAGNALFRHLAAEALRRGCGRMEWVCLDWNELAISFYEKRGGEHLNDWRYYRLTEDGLRKLTRDEPVPE